LSSWKLRIVAHVGSKKLNAVPDHFALRAQIEIGKTIDTTALTVSRGAMTTVEFALGGS
jgi:hypothetical protein